jgi:hypothetical protein
MGARSKDQHIKLTSFDQRLMFELLGEGVKSFCCLQNQGFFFDYY